MRGSLLRIDPSKATVCAFCAARYGAPRAPPHISRRLLSSSSPKLISTTSRLHNAPGGGGFGRPSFGRPAFGNANATAGGGFAKPAFGSGKVELTDEERELANRLKAQTEAREREDQQKAEEQRRIAIRINRGAGPQATRAGRPDPEVFAERGARMDRLQQRLSIAELDAQARNQGGGGGFRISRPGARPGSDGSEWQSSQLRTKSARDVAREHAGQHMEEKSEYQRNKPAAYSGYVSPNARFARDREATRSAGGFKVIREAAMEESMQSRGRHIPPQQTSRPLPAYQQRYAEPMVEEPSSEYNIQPDEVPPPPPPSAQVMSMREEELQRQREIEERTARRERERYVEAPAAVQQHQEMVHSNKGRGKAKKGDRRADFVTDADDESAYSEAQAKRELKRQRKEARLAKKKAEPTPIFLPEYISVGNLATALRVRYDDFVEKMEELGFEETGADFILNGENAGLIAQEYNFEALIDKSDSEDLKPREPAEDMSIYPPRPPVVTIMGHVDHGKTTILDFLRKSSVAAGEAGGITQHIGAFSVPMPSGKVITFLDTPGHAAFLSMRQRGANVTDIVVLVVAADDSVKPQTIEAINHAKGAKVPIIVAINKVDKPEADIERVKGDLARHGVEIEDYGGDTQVVAISGKTGQGMDTLEEAILTLSDVIDMRADTEGAAEGIVLEASVKSMGKVATILVRAGTMRPGDFIVAGQTWARIRCMRDEAGREVLAATPGQPVEIDGWREQPMAGDEVLQALSEQKAKSVVDYRIEAVERDKLAEDMEAINEERKFVARKREQEKAAAKAAKEHEGEEDFEHEVPEEAEGGPKRVYFIIKGDVSGSVEAVVDSISVVGNTEIQPYVLRSGIGGVSEFDIEHAAVAKGCIVNFSQPMDPYIKRKAERMKVPVLDHDIIYKLVDDVKDKLSEYLPPIITQKVVGEAEIAQVFDITIKGRKQKPVAGCKVRNGTIGRNSKIRVIRKGKEIYDGTLDSLKNVKKDIMEAKKGGECGMGFDGWTDFEVGDQIQAYETKEEKRHL